MYQLSQKALDQISEARPRGIVIDLAKVLLCSENTVNRHLRENVPNGDLTKVAALEVIRQGTGLADEEILESAGVEKEAV